LPFISGIIVPLVTPLSRQLDVDRIALRRLIEHVISGGVQGIFLLGSTGEGSALDTGAKRAVIDSGVNTVNKRVPVYINISSNSYADSLKLGEHAAKSGATALVLSAPSYFKMNREEALNYFSSIAENTDLPLILYNAPQYVKTSLEKDWVEELASHPAIVGIKDSSGDPAFLEKISRIQKDKDFSLLNGPEELLARALDLGFHGGVCGGANLYPRLYTLFFRSHQENNANSITKLEIQLKQIREQIYQSADSPLRIVIGLKYLLSYRGLCSDQLAMPVYGMLKEDQKKCMQKLDHSLRDLGY